MKRSLLALVFGLWAVAAQAQWQVPAGSVPIGRGTNVIGFNSAAPGASGNCLVSNGTTWVAGTCVSVPGGSNTQVQFNNAGAFGGITGATTDGTKLTLVAPILGTPTSVTLTNGIGLPISTGLSGAGTGVLAALAVNVGSAGAPVLFNGAGGTPSSLVLTNATGLPTTSLTGALQAAQEPAHTGDVTNSAGSLALAYAGIVPIAKGGTAQATALAARGSSGLAVETQCTNGDSAFAIPVTCHTATTSANFTASRIWTLPAANGVNAGHQLDICDQQLTLTGTNSMVVTAAGADAIIGHNGSNTTITMTNPGACLTLKSDGTSKWNNPTSMLVPSIQIKTTGSGTITTPNGPLYCKARIIGGGGGGAGSGTTPAAATAGTATTLGALTANGGALGSTTAGTTAAGGTASGCNILNLQGGAGGGASNQNQTIGGGGGQSFFGGGSPGGFSSAAPVAATANSGGGGGGGGQQAAANGGGGGGAGGYCEHIYTNPIPATLSYAVGSGGNAGGAGTGGTVGAAGGSGWIEYACYFQ